MKKQNRVICDTDSFIVHVKTDDIYEKIAEDVETRLYTLNYELNSPLRKGKIKSNQIIVKRIRWKNYEKKLQD